MSKKILIVDDEPQIVKMVGLRLKAQGYEIITASDGQEGLDKARSENPDLIILDLMMPKMNGYEVCTMLKQDTRYQKIPVMMFTAKAQPEDERLGKECGADAYMHKPYRPDEMLASLKKLLGEETKNAEA